MDVRVARRMSERSGCLLLSWLVVLTVKGGFGNL
jgi:hypothetical protein